MFVFDNFTQVYTYLPLTLDFFPSLSCAPLWCPFLVVNLIIPEINYNLEIESALWHSFYLVWSEWLHLSTFRPLNRKTHIFVSGLERKHSFKSRPHVSLEAYKKYGKRKLLFFAYLPSSSISIPSIRFSGISEYNWDQMKHLDLWTVRNY